MKDIRTPIASIYGQNYSRHSKAWESQITALKDKFHDAIENVQVPGKNLTDIPSVMVQKSAFTDVLQFLKSDSSFQYEFLTDYTATDESPREPRFDLVVHLLSPKQAFKRIRIKTQVSENETIPSIIPLWAGANWAEREIFDMFGIRFENHPDLRRILMDCRWKGHPLRKDYPLKGYQFFATPEPPMRDILMKDD